jgi:dsDNA-binding SOS-regulon protein
MQWDKIMEAAKRLENLLRRADVDFNEAQKAIGYYLFKGCDDSAMERYLKEMAENPAPAQQAHTRLLPRTLPHLAKVEPPVRA